MQADKPIPESYWVIPGQILAGEYPTSEYDPARARQRIAAFLREGFDTFIDLTSPDDASPYEALLKQEAAELGLQIHIIVFQSAITAFPAANKCRPLSTNSIRLASKDAKLTCTARAASGVPEPWLAVTSCVRGWMASRLSTCWLSGGAKYQNRHFTLVHRKQPNRKILCATGPKVGV